MNSSTLTNKRMLKVISDCLEEYEKRNKCPIGNTIKIANRSVVLDHEAIMYYFKGKNRKFDIVLKNKAI